MQPVSPVPQGSPIPRILPPAPPSVSPNGGVPPLPPAGAGLPDRTVRITGVSVDGATVFPASAFDAYTRDLVGPAIPLPRIDAARQAILQTYRSAGYVLSAVSASLDASGQLRFIVTEGHIASVKLSGDIGPAGVQVLRFLNRLTEAQPIDAATLERYLLLAGDVPGVTVKSILEPSDSEPGALNLVAQVSRQAVSGLGIFDNRAFYQTGPVEGLLVMDLNSFTSYGEKTELSFYHTFLNTQNFGQAALEMFLGGSGLKVRVYGGAGNAIPDSSGTQALSAANYHGFTDVFGAAFIYPFIRSRQQTLNGVLNFDALESNIRTGPAPSDLTTTSYDSLRVLRLGEDYAMSDLWLGTERPAFNTLSVRLSKGLPILGAETNGYAANAARQGEQADFFKLNFELTRTQTFYTFQNGNSIALMGLLTGQWSDAVLPPAEQFYLGGLRFTRGYYAGQVAGDKALAATAELQFNTTLNLSALRLSGEVPAQFYVFYDWGETWENNATILPAMINSSGGGTRVQVTHNVEVDFEALARFNRYPNGSGPTVSALNGIGLYWRVVGRF
ncbi:MAG TPA: ShlB/FhaC/HecB family hemolysin secretion/activation protein [Rhodopila sp.]|nr:ShlB/FhaC/HecB family hemolysin secretion/activation protein [Rhodopila sp.]